MSLMAARIYGSSTPGVVLDPWSYQEPSDNKPSVCRSIPVTPAMREADRRQQQMQAVRRSDWTLGEEIRRRLP